MPTVPHSLKPILAVFSDKEATAMDRAEAFKLLSELKYTNPQIALMTMRSAQAVEQGLILATASGRVASLVRADRISAACVIRVLRWARTNQRDATQIIEHMVLAAQQEGKDRATPKHLPVEMRASQPRKVCRDTLTDLVSLKPKIEKALAKMLQVKADKAKVELNLQELRSLSDLLEG